MFNSMVLEVALGLFFIYFLVASICSAIQECIATWLGWRAKDLENAITMMIGDDATKRLYDHALVTKATKPQHLDPKVFAHAVLDMHARATAADPSTVAVASPKAGDPSLSRAINAIGTSTGSTDVQALIDGLEHWYSSIMVRVSGQYKRNSQVVIFLVAIVVTCLLNIDSIAIGNMLASNSTVRQSVAAVAEKQVQQGQGSGKPSTLAVVSSDVRNLEALQIPFGWSWKGSLSQDPSIWARKSGGLAISILAATMGAPFWFDLLNKLVNVRSSGQKPS